MIENTKMIGSWQRGFDAAIAASLHSTGPTIGMKLGAALYAGSKLLSIGFNDFTRTHTNYQFETYNGNIHAEAMTLIRRWHYEKPKNLILYIARITTNPEQTIVQCGCSRPCNICMKLIRNYGVRRIRFYDEFGIPCEEKL